MFNRLLIAINGEKPENPTANAHKFVYVHFFSYLCGLLRK